MSDSRPEPAETAHPRRIRSFTRRSGRLSDRQQKAWDELADRVVVDIPRVGSDTSLDPLFSFNPTESFGRPGRFVVEIGTGRGEAIVHAAATEPDTNFLGIEVYLPGVGQTLIRMRNAGVENIRMAIVDAADAVDTMIEPGTVDEVRLWFPDPWHKARHNKRRLVTLDFAARIHRLLAPGGVWRMATDWEDYAVQMHEVLTQAPGFDFDDYCERFEGRPLTNFETKGMNVGRRIYDLCGVRRDLSEP